MAVVKEWVCPDHGPFEGTHPICPGNACLSEGVTQEFRTPPKLRSESTTRTDRGLKRSASIYALSDLRSAREGEASKPAYQSESGTEMLWGGQVQEKLGASFDTLTAQAQAPLGNLRHNSGMRDAATQAGITSVTRAALPPSFDTTVAKGDTDSVNAASGLLPKGMKSTRSSGKGLL